MRLCLNVCSVWILLQSASWAAVIVFSPTLDADSTANSSGTTPYSANTTQSSAPAGITDNGVATSDSDTFFFTDAGTGIGFSFDMSWSSTGGFLNPTGSALGVGANSLIDGSETVSFGVSNLSVDLSSYVAGSVGGVNNPFLSSAHVGFDLIDFNSFTGGTAEIADITGSTGTVQFNQASGNFDLGTDGLTATETSLTIGINNGSAAATPDFTISATRFNVQLDIQEVPEPSSLLLMCLGSASVVGYRLRKKRGANNETRS